MLTTGKNSQIIDLIKQQIQILTSRLVFFLVGSRRVQTPLDPAVFPRKVTTLWVFSKKDSPPEKIGRSFKR